LDREKRMRRVCTEAPARATAIEPVSGPVCALAAKAWHGLGAENGSHFGSPPACWRLSGGTLHRKPPAHTWWA
jgi:hypothetical protein